MGAGIGILTALLGIGGSIGGGAASDASARSAASRARRDARSSRDVITPEVNPLSNPLIASIVAQNLAALGVVDPTLILSSGPLGQVEERIRASGLTGQEQFGVFAAINDIREGLAAGTIDPSQPISDPTQHFALQFLSQFSPFGTDIFALFRAQEEFEQRQAPVLANLEAIREAGLERTGLVNEALLGLTRDVAEGSDLGAIREAERARLARELADRRDVALQRANAGGFNPGGDLEALQELETDADLVALERALGLVTGEQTAQANSLSLLLGLNPSNQASNLNLSSVLPSTGGSVGAGVIANQPSSSGVGTALSSGGNALALLGINQALRAAGSSSDVGSNAPAAGGSRFPASLGIDPASFPLLLGG